MTAQGQRESQILSAEGDAKAQVLRAEAEAEAISRVFTAIHDSDVDDQTLAYQYLQMLPQIANGDANKVWVVPAELSSAMEGLGRAFGRPGDDNS